MKIPKGQALEELHAIRKKMGGLLPPKSVVDFARDENTALHGFFEWDDSKAAEEHRLRQARDLIRVVVEYTPSVEQNVRVFVSLTNERGDNGGYRTTVDVLSKEALTKRMLDDAERELLTFYRKYRVLRNLAGLSGVFSAIEKFMAKEDTAKAKKKPKR